MPKHAELLYPTILVADTSERELIRLALVLQGRESIKSEISKQAQDLQLELENFLQHNNISVKSLNAFAVIKNGPSLTGIRMGLVCVNTLAWLNSKPIIELEEDFTSSVNQLEAGKQDFKIVKQVVPNA